MTNETLQHDDARDSQQSHAPVKRRRRLLLAGLALGVGTASAAGIGSFTMLAGARPAAAAAADAWPQRPIRWIIPFLPGTGPDTTARIVGEFLAAKLGQQVVIENKPGAGGNLGAQIAANAAADGYTWVYGSTTMAASMRLYRKPGYDALRDFDHLGRIGISDLTILVSPSSPLTSVKALFDKARNEPGKLSYASGGVGTPSHLATEELLAAIGAKALHVPYKGATETLNAVISTEVDFGLTLSQVAITHVRSGKVRALAVTGGERNPFMPDVPTLTEAGAPEVRLTSFGGLSVPAGVPAPVRGRIVAALEAVVKDPALRERLMSQGTRLAYAPADAFTRDMREEIVATEGAMKRVGLEPQ